MSGDFARCARVVDQTGVLEGDTHFLHVGQYSHACFLRLLVIRWLDNGCIDGIGGQCRQPRRRATDLYKHDVFFRIETELRQ